MTRTHALAAGTLVIALVAVAIPGLSVPGALLVSVAALATPRRWWSSQASRTALVVGAWLVAARLLVGPSTMGPPQRTPGADRDAVAARSDGPIRGEVRSTVRLAGGRQTVLLTVDGGGLVYARLPRFPEFVPGDRVVIDETLEPLPEAPAPEAAGWVGYLRRIGVTSTIEAREVLPDGSAAGLSAWLAAMRDRAGDLLGVALPEPEAGLAAGILVGLRERVDPTLASDFTAAGLTHVVAISGWNVAIVGGMVGALARPLSHRRRAFVIALVIGAYTLFAGASASVVRAALMAGVALLAREGGRRAGAGRALALATALMLLLDPGTVLDPGFQLSACATAGLLAWSDGLGARIDRLAPRLPGAVRESLAVSLSAQAATLPIVLLDFGRLSLVSPAANLVVAPLVPFVMAGAAVALALGALVAGGVPPVVLGIPLALAALPLQLLAGAGHVAASVPYASLQLPPFVAAPAAFAAALGLAVVARSQRRSAP